MLRGTIIKGIGGFYYIATENGVYECRARGKFRREGINPTVGDIVNIGVLDEKNKKGSLDEIEPRKNCLIRPRVANIDQAVIVFASVSPDFNPDIMDRFIVLAEQQNLEIIICINKIDIDTSEKYKEIYDLYKSAGFDIFAVSAEENIGSDELFARLRGKVSVLAGPSGVGKSSIINMIDPKIAAKVGEISKKIERGKHTTRQSELLELEKGTFLVDSPGFTSLDMSGIEPDQLQYYFREFNKYLPDCRFTGCMHINEDEKYCGIKSQVGKNISESRYHRYIDIYNEIIDERKR
ncbi:MAG: ribosome small subunit-dependent GTPase A [Candidatus Metalachnospira sp.]|nr:ribosome small subunit-dependent GTPase A [Candidatus Metalachnospira sp.]